MKHARRMSLALALMLIFSTAVLAASAGTYLGSAQVVNCKSWVTLREYASTSAPSVTKVPLGAWVETYYYNSQFTECYYAGLHGYILSTYLSNGSSGSSASDSASYLGKRYIVNCKEFVTLRQYASTSAPTVTKVAKGQQVDAYYYNSDFCRCYYNGMEGYILSYYLGSSSSSSSAPSWSSSASGSYLGSLQVVNCSNWVTLRQSASTGAASVTKVPLGAWVEGYYYNSQFTECYYNGMHGYILSTYLSDGSSGSKASDSSSYLGKRYVVNCKEFVTLRQYASTSAPTVTKVAKGQQVDAYYYNGTFCRCYYNGMEGYILSSYLGVKP